MTKILLNEKAIELDQECSLFELIERTGTSIKGCAVAVNNTVIPKAQWNEITMSDNDAISIFNVVAGG